MRTSLLCLLALSFVGCSRLSALQLATSAPEPIALEPENFNIEYNGEGSVTIDNDSIVLSPKAPTSGDETHSALVLIKNTVDNPIKNFELIVDMTTDEQLRTGSAPNDWEVFWLLFNYNGSVTEKTTNFFMSKPSFGAELGIAHGQLGQNFLSTEADAKTAIAQRHVFKYRRVDDQFTVHRDDVLFYSFTAAESFPAKLYGSKGAIGLYVEDAKVTIHSIKLLNLDSGSIPDSVIPNFLASLTEIKSPNQDMSLSRPLSNTSATGPLLWSCNLKSLKNSYETSGITDCLKMGTLNSSGVFSWIPSASNIGSWLFSFEASEERGGFANQSVYVQVRPQWTASPLFLYDSEFNIEKNVDGVSRAVSRNLASENNKTVAWPSLVAGGSGLSLTGLSEASPWVVDNDTSLTALHFDGTQDPAGIPIPVSGLGATEDLRISYWFKRDDFNSKVAISAPHSDGALESRHWFGVISSRFHDSDNDTDCSDTFDAPEDWVFVTTAVQQGVMTTYTNGRAVCSVNLPGVHEFASPLRLAPLSQTFYPFAGRVSEIAGYKLSTPAQVFQDFSETADRYRKVKVGPIASVQNIALHWDAASAERGMYPSPTATVNSWSDLGSTAQAKIIGGFNGTAASGFTTSPAASSHLTFDGIDDYLQISQDSSLSLGPTWTIEAWLQPGVARGVDTNFAPTDPEYHLYKTVFEKGAYDIPGKQSHGFGMRIGYDNSLNAYIINNYGFTDTVKGPTLLTSNQWYHVVVSFNKTTKELKAYVNGRLDSTTSVNYLQDTSFVARADGDILAGDSDAFVGIPFDTDGRRRFNGKLAVLRVYNSALSPAAVKSNCKAQMSRFSVTCQP